MSEPKKKDNTWWSTFPVKFCFSNFSSSKLAFGQDGPYEWRRQSWYIVIPQIRIFVILKEILAKIIDWLFVSLSACGCFKRLDGCCCSAFGSEFEPYATFRERRLTFLDQPQILSKLGFEHTETVDQSFKIILLKKNKKYGWPS